MADKHLVYKEDLKEIVSNMVEIPTEMRVRMLGAINRAKTVDAVEVVHGRWEQVQRWATKAKYRCSVCGREIMSATTVNIAKYPYCHCGAKMDGGAEDGK